MTVELLPHINNQNEYGQESITLTKYECTVKILVQYVSNIMYNFNANLKYKSVIAWTHSSHHGSISILAKRLYIILAFVSL